MKIINEISKNEKCFIFQKIRFKTSRSVKDMIENHSYLIQRYTDDLFNISSNRRFYREKLLKKKKILYTKIFIILKFILLKIQ